MASVTEGYQRNVLNNLSSTCHIDLHQLSTLLLTVRPGAAPSTRPFPPLRTPTEPIPRRNDAGGRSRDRHQLYQTRPLTAVAAAGLACPTSASSAISMPAVDVDSLHKSSFTKSSQEDWGLSDCKSPQVSKILRVFWPISTMLYFGWSQFFPRLPTVPISFPVFYEPFQTHQLKFISP